MTALREAVARDSTARERDRERAAGIDSGPVSYLLTGAALGAAIESSIRSYPPAARLSDGERDALAQICAERVLRKGPRRGPARAVLAWIDRAERMPATAAREESRIERGSTGREHVRAIVRGVMIDRRDWRDVAESHESAREREAGGPMIVSAEGIAPGHLADSIAREAAGTGDPVPAVPVDAEHLAAPLADILAPMVGTSRANVYAALASASAPLAAVAAAEGIGLNACKQRVKRGADAVAASIDGAALILLARKVANAEGWSRPEREGSPALDGPALAALDAVAGALDVARERAHVRPAPVGPVLLRATRRNLRAERMTGRYGRPLPAWAGGQSRPGARPDVTASRQVP